jgi:D-glycero-alpha-D-manno-heptose-7-phosphate kinase
MRISLAGGGTDVPPLAAGIGGRVVCAAIGLHVRVTVEPFDPGWVRLEGAWGLADAGDVRPEPRTVTRRAAAPPCADVAFRMVEAARAASGVDDGVRVTVESDLTPGTGLGGSASAAVALLAAFRAALGEPAPVRRLAMEAAHLERDVLGLRCGMQDQLCAAAGGLLDLRFFEDGFDITPIVAPPALARDLGEGLLLVDTSVRRVSGEVLDIANNGRAREVQAELVAAADETARGLRLGSLPFVLAGMRRSASAKLRRGGRGALPEEWTRNLIRLGAIIVRACGAGAGGHVLIWADPTCHPGLIEAVSPRLVRRPALGVPGVEIFPT